MSTLPETLPKRVSDRLQRRGLGFSFRPPGTALALAAIVLIAALLRFGDLGNIGDANLYYTAAVKSMLSSWHNFFFAAAEPGGSVSVDKPPLGLWIQAISALIFGVNGFAVVLPQLLAGLCSIVLTFFLVRRWFGNIAGLLAALVLAVTPVAIAVERNNTPDATLILALLLATWAFIKATETAKLRYLLLGAFLVGVGFNIKMLQAYLPLPAFYALYFLSARLGWWRKLFHLTLATLVLLPVSLSWAVLVDLTPAGQRPYVGSSTSNSELELIIGYNGLQRLVGGLNRQVTVQRLFGLAPSTSQGRLLGRANPALTSNQFSSAQQTNVQRANQPSPSEASVNEFAPNGLTANTQPIDAQRATTQSVNSEILARLPNAFPQLNSNGSAQPAAGMNVGFGGFGMFGTGSPSLWRFFEAGLAAQVSWLLPFALVVMVALALGLSWRQPQTALPRGLILWGGWLLTCFVFFSVAGFFHPYYLAMMGPPLAAIVAMGVIALWRMRTSHPVRAALILLLAAGVTLTFQLYAVRMYLASGWWLALPVVLGVVGLILLFVSLPWPASRLPAASFVLVTLAMIIVPAVWSGLTTVYADSSSALPQAYGETRMPARGDGGGARMRPPVNGQINRRPATQPPLGMGGPGAGAGVDERLLEYLQAHTQGVKYLLVVPNSQVGASYVLATGRPVLYAGGFSGNDPVIDGVKLAELVEKGEVRYVLWGGLGGGRNNPIAGYLDASCKVVNDIGLGSAAGSGTAPNGVRERTVSGRPGQILYLCGS